MALFAMVGDSSSYTYPKFEEQVIEGSEFSDDKIAVIPISGVILKEGTSGDIFSETVPSAEMYVEQIRQAAHDDSVKALILSVDSPGGSVSASDLIFHEVLKFLETGKPLIAHYSEVAASGAIYVSVPADVIITEPTALVGSVGTIMTNLNVEGLFEKVGLKEEVFKSGEYKDIFSSTREMTDDEKEIVNGLIDHDTALFENIVITHRPEIDQADYDTVFDARIFTATQAKDIGLVDDIGYFEDARKEAELLSGVTDYSLVQYEVPFSFTSFFKGFTSSFGSSSVDKLTQLVLSDHPRSMFLWK